MRIPLSLSVYEHAAQFLGLTPPAFVRTISEPW